MSSPRKEELLEASYRYVLEHGLADVSLRPLSAAVGSSPRVLLYLFGSKEGLVRELLARARADEIGLLDGLTVAGPDETAAGLWSYLSDPRNRPLLVLWLEAYARSLVEPEGPWSGFARGTVTDWLDLLAAAQPESERGTPDGLARRTAILAQLRGALLDLLATSDADRVGRAVRSGGASATSSRAGGGRATSAPA